MTYLPLYPVGAATAVLVLATVAGWRRSGHRWGAALGGTGVLHALGYLVVAQAIYGLTMLRPGQMVLAIVAIAITTKLVVFAPVMVARIVDPGLEPTVGRRQLVVGIAAGWLVQASLGILFMFPVAALQSIFLWIIPGSPVYIVSCLMLVGVVVAQAVIAGRIYAAAPGGVATEVETASTTTELIRDGQPAAAPDGGQERCDRDL